MHLHKCKNTHLLHSVMHFIRDVYATIKTNITTFNHLFQQTSLRTYKNRQWYIQSRSSTKMIAMLNQTTHQECLHETLEPVLEPATRTRKNWNPTELAFAMNWNQHEPELAMNQNQYELELERMVIARRRE